MRKSILMVIMGLVLAGISPNAKGLNSFSDDARSKVTSRRAPWSAIGKLFLPDGGWCTATLVARDLVLTAAHCVIATKTKRLKSGTFSFYPGYIDGVGDISSTATYIWWGTNDPATYRGDDWALLRLHDPLGNSAGWMGVRGMDLSDYLHDPRFYAAGYSSDFRGGDSASWEKGCVFTKVDVGRHVFLHNCDSTCGASGGPIFEYDDVNQPLSNHIVALQVAEFRDGGEESLLHVPYSDDKANIAVPASAFIETLKQIIAGE
jgi:V8-like Glu-specific endopeptidase